MLLDLLLYAVLIAGYLGVGCLVRDVLRGDVG